MTPVKTIDEIAAEAIEAYLKAFGEEPAALGIAPGRVNLIGDHVDYEGGLVFPMTINRWVAVAAGPNGKDQLLGVRATDPDTIDEWIGLKAEGAGSSWLRYVAGVIDGYDKQWWEQDGLNVAVSSSLPMGAGLSSSAALESATAVALEALGAPALSPTDRALLCQKAEHDFAHVPCGIMDQLTVCHGIADTALKIDCRSLEVDPVTLPNSAEIIVINSGVHHELGQSEYPKRRKECRKAARALKVELLREASLESMTGCRSLWGITRKRARHVISEIERVKTFAGHLQSGDLVRAGKCMYESHESLRDLYEASCPELDTLVNIASEVPWVYGARMTGGGFGGSIVCLVQKGAYTAGHIEWQYERATGIKTEAMKVRAVEGAHARQLPTSLLKG